MVVRLKDLDSPRQETKSGLIRLNDLEETLSSSKRKKDEETRAQIMQLGSSVNPMQRPYDPANINDSPIAKVTRSLSQIETTPAEPKKSTVQKVLDTIQYPFDRMAYHAAPKANYIGGETVDGATNPRERLAAQQHEAGRDTTGNATMDKVGDFVGQAAAIFTPGQGVSAGKLFNNPLTNKVVGSIGNKLGTGLGGRVAQEAAREGLVGAGQMAQYELATGKGDIGEVAKQAAYGAAGGAIGGAAVPVIGAGIKAGLNKFAGTKIGESLSRLSSKTKVIDEAADTITAQPSVTDATRQAGQVTESLDDFLYKHLDDVPRSEIDALSQTDKTEIASYIRESIGEVAATRTVDAIPSTSVQQRGFTNTLRASEKSSPQLKQIDSTYTPITNEETILQANNRIGTDLEASRRYVMNDGEMTAEKVTTGLRLLDEYTAAGNHAAAVEVAEYLAKEGTKAGQAVQAYSIYNRLSPEGILIHAHRVADKTNELLPKYAKEVKVTADMATQITDLAETTKAMTGVKTLASDVMDIIERGKAGETLTSADTDILRRFIDESKQFVKEVEKKPRVARAPKQPTDTRVRDNLVSFLDAQEAAAKERLRARGIHISSTPLDVWADYAVIGAAKMAKGAVKFVDWSEQMVKDLGESIRPYLESLYDRATEAYNTSTKKITTSTISNAERLTEKVIKTKQLDDLTANNLRAMAQKVSSLSGDAKTLASQDLQAILQTLEKPTLGKKISSTQTMAQLLNPKTQMRNALGNELFYRVERLNKYVSTPIDFARSKITGSERTVTFRTNNQGQYWKNFIAGGRAGWKGVSVNGLQTQFDLTGQSFRSKLNPLTYLEKTLGAALRSFDNAAYMRAVNETIGEMATLRAINEGLKGAERKAAIQKYIREADENILAIADEYGKYVTFQDNNTISAALTGLKRGMNKIPLLNINKEFGIGDLVLKYPKTPGALLMRALEYSPAGFLRSIGQMYKAGLYKGSEVTAREITEGLSRAIVGTGGITGLGYFLLDNGILTGSSHKDKDIRDLQRSAGQGQYQINISAIKRWAASGFDKKAAKIQQDDILYTYDWMQPISIGMSLGANIRKNQLSGDKGTEGTLGTIINSVDGGLNTLVEQSVLSGLKSAVEGYPGQTVMDKITDILADVPSSFVPTIINQVKQVTDNKKRETYDPSLLQQSINVAKAKIPGLADTLPQQYDTLGRPKTTYQENSAFNVFLNPGFSSKYQLSPEAQMIVDLINETGDETLAPRVPGKTVDGQKLTGEQLSRLQQLQGEETARRLQNINPNASTQAKSKLVKKTLTNSSEKAKKQLKKEYKLN